MNYRTNWLLLEKFLVWLTLKLTICSLCRCTCFRKPFYGISNPVKTVYNLSSNFQNWHLRNRNCQFHHALFSLLNNSHLLWIIINFNWSYLVPYVYDYDMRRMCSRARDQSIQLILCLCLCFVGISQKKICIYVAEWSSYFLILLWKHIDQTIFYRGSNFLNQENRTFHKKIRFIFFWHIWSMPISYHLYSKFDMVYEINDAVEDHLPLLELMKQYKSIILYRVVGKYQMKPMYKVEIFDI